MSWVLAAGVGIFGLLSGVAAAADVGPFQDVGADSAHAEAVEWAWRNAITEGCSDDEFCPGDPATRAQMVAFLKRLAEAEVVDAATVQGQTAEELEGEPGPVGPRGPSGAQGPPGPAGPAAPSYSEIVFFQGNGTGGIDPYQYPDRTDEWRTNGGFASEQPEGSMLFTRPLSADLFSPGAQFEMEYIVSVPDGSTACARLYDLVADAPVPGSTACHTEDGTRDPDQLEGGDISFTRLRTSVELPETGEHDLQVQFQDPDAECVDVDGVPECYRSWLHEARLLVETG